MPPADSVICPDEIEMSVEPEVHAGFEFHLIEFLRTGYFPEFLPGAMSLRISEYDLGDH